MISSFPYMSPFLCTLSLCISLTSSILVPPSLPHTPFTYICHPSYSLPMSACHLPYAYALFLCAFPLQCPLLLYFSYPLPLCLPPPMSSSLTSPSPLPPSYPIPLHLPPFSQLDSPVPGLAYLHTGRDVKRWEKGVMRRDQGRLRGRGYDTASWYGFIFNCSHGLLR